MHRLAHVVFGMEEAARLLAMKRPEHHRLALILLDNVAELQLHRATQSELTHDEFMERLRLQVAAVPIETLPPELQEIASRRPLTAERKAKLRRFFGDKVRYLSVEKRRIAPAVAEVLEYLHEYRNHAYHGARFSSRIVRSIGLLLFELNCDLLPVLPLDSFSWSSSEDYSWLTAYGLSSRFGHSEDVVGVLSRGLRDSLPISVADVRSSFMEEATQRFAAIDDALAFLQENVTSIKSRPQALSAAQYHAFTRQVPAGETPPSRQRFSAPHGMRFLERLRKQSQSIQTARSSQEAFRRFARVINAVKSLEDQVLSFEGDVDAYIQMQVDIARGK